MDQENEDVEESLGLFEAAFQARHVDLSTPKIQEIVVIHDDSDQDQTALGLANAVKAMSGATVREVPAPALGMDAAEKVAFFQEASAHADLVVLPAPFGEEIGSLNTESLSSVVDIFLPEARVPVLIARHPIDGADDLLTKPIVLLDWQQRFQGIAASCACFFAQQLGEVNLVATVAPSTMNEVEALLGGDQDDLQTFHELIQRAKTRLSGGIVAAVQKLESEQGFRSKFTVHQGAISATKCAELALESGGFSVCAYLAETQSQTLNLLRDLILQSKQPVLCLPI